MKNKKIYEGDIAFRFYEQLVGVYSREGEIVRKARWEQMDYFDKHDIALLGGLLNAEVI